MSNKYEKVSAKKYIYILSKLVSDNRQLCMEKKPDGVEVTSTWINNNIVAFNNYYPDSGLKEYYVVNNYRNYMVQRKGNKNGWFIIKI